jgi:UDP-N-acetylglucosamine/UDP-N-acetylgalactosamine diphosphorylase
MRECCRFHIARKQIPSRDGPVRGIKLEKFIFDVFHLAESPLLVEVRRTEEFTPVKNADGPGQTDCPATARSLIMSLHRKWVEDAGGKVEGDLRDGLEVSPLASYAGEGLAERCAGERFRTNTVIE